MPSITSDHDELPVGGGAGDAARDDEREDTDRKARAVLGRRIGAVIIVLASIVAMTISWLDHAAVLPGGPGENARQSDGRVNSDAALVDLNTDDESMLALLPGIGTLKARRIIEERQRNGDFSGVDDLRRVAGIGDQTIEGLRPLVRAVPAVQPRSEPTP